MVLSRLECDHSPAAMVAEPKHEPERGNLFAFPPFLAGKLARMLVGLHAQRAKLSATGELSVPCLVTRISQRR